MPRRSRFVRLLRALAAAAALLVLGALVRARFLPPVEVPVLYYPRLAETASDGGTTSLADFFSQLEDLLEGGFESVTPRRLRQYAVWGRRLPLRPFVIAIGEPSATLVEGGIPKPQDAFALTRIPGAAEDILRFFGYVAVVVGDPAAPGASGTVSAADAAAATKRGWLLFPARGSFGLSGEEGVAKIGVGADLSALPRVTVVGGAHRFAARVAQDALVPGEFGTLRLDHVAGPALPLAVLAYLDDHSPPFARGESGGLAAGETLDIPLRMVLYYRQRIQRSEVTRPEGWHLPLSGPEEGVPLDLDPPPDPEPGPEPAGDGDFELDLGPEPGEDFAG